MIANVTSIPSKHGHGLRCACVQLKPFPLFGLSVYLVLRVVDCGICPAGQKIPFHWGIFCSSSTLPSWKRARGSVALWCEQCYYFGFGNRQTWTPLHLPKGTFIQTTRAQNIGRSPFRQEIRNVTCYLSFGMCANLATGCPPHSRPLHNKMLKTFLRMRYGGQELRKDHLQSSHLAVRT